MAPEPVPPRESAEAGAAPPRERAEPVPPRESAEPGAAPRRERAEPVPPRTRAETRAAPPRTRARATPPREGTDAAPPRERADAARNRARVLAAAERLLAAGGPVTMERIAAAAGVGKGTLYRRYPDVPSIAVALLDEHERDLQDRLLRGPPPLGPGAPPAERLAAFYAALVALLERHGHLALAAETGARRYATGAYRAWALHVGALAAESGVEDTPALVDALLAPLDPDVFAHQRAAGIGADRIAAGLGLLARRVLGGGAPAAAGRRR